LPIARSIRRRALVFRTRATIGTDGDLVKQSRIAIEVTDGRLLLFGSMETALSFTT